MKKILLVNDTSLTLHYGCDLLMLNIFKFLNNNKVKITNSIYHEEAIVLNQTNKLKIINSDLILINAEGTLHRNENSNQNKVNEIFKFIYDVKNKLKKKIIIFNATMEKLNTKDFKILRLVDEIFVREIVSKKYLKKKKIKSNVLPDLTLLTTKTTLQKDNQLLVTDCSENKYNNKLNKFSQNNSLKFTRMIYHFGFFKLIKYLVLILYKYFPFLKIDKFFIFFKRKYSMLFFNKILSSRCVLTGRFHCICFCLVNKIPFICLKSDTHKIKSLLKYFNISNRLIKINKIKNLNFIKFEQFSAKENYNIDKFLKKTKTDKKILIEKIQKLN